MSKRKPPFVPPPSPQGYIEHDNYYMVKPSVLSMKPHGCNMWLRAFDELCNMLLK